MTSQRAVTIVPQTQSPKSKPKIQPVKDICTDTIGPTDACHNNPKLPFVLTKSHKIGTMSIDLNRPFIFTTFNNSTTPQPPDDAETVPKVALLGLGILLLELWYEETLEAHFALAEPHVGHVERRDKAQRWLDDVYERNDEPPALYHNAVSRCVSVIVGGEAQLRRWGEGGLWDAVCRDVVEPLFENCRMWR